MPIVAHNNLPTFDRLRQEGLQVLDRHRARHQDIRELHVGVLNMMPDSALQATERQFFRLLDVSNHIAQLFVHPFTLPELPRGEQAQRHIDRYYDSFEQLQEQGLDALIITGANITGSDLSKQPFWQPLKQVVDWASLQVTSTICSCIASHAVLDFRYDLKRQKQRKKIWGVFEHRVSDKKHPLVRGINSRFNVPHSRWNDISIEQCRSAGIPILAKSDQVGMHLVTSPDGIRFVMFQGHPEYDTISLLKEYKREVSLYLHGQLTDYPPLVEHYFDRSTRAILREHKSMIIEAIDGNNDFPELKILPRLENTWRDTTLAIVSRWIGLVYQLTNQERTKPFMDHIDPDKPLANL